MRKWAVDLVSTENLRRGGIEPYGYSDTQHTLEENSSTRQQRANNSELKVKKAWEVAKSPSKSIFMNLFMAWMSGTSLNIFSIMITLYSFINPVKAILGTQAIFSRFEDPAHNLILAKLIYIAINLFMVSVAIYKCWVLGLLPVTISDWVSLLAVKESLEFSTGFLI